MQWFGRPVPQNRFLGQVDQDDPTNLPMGLAAVCQDFDFTRDSGGPTCATTRAGHNTAMQCLDEDAPVTGLLGFVYQPESASDPFFQLPLAFQPTEGSQYENPVGTGHMVKFPQTNFTEPQGAHAIQASAGNKVFSAYSDLTKPLSALSTMDPKAKTLNPFGMKPFGFYWVPNTPVLAGEVCCPPSPTTGNGHTYQAQNSGTTGANPLGPVFPLTDGGTVNDNGIIWKEKTMVIANRLPPPPQPIFSIVGSGGTIVANKDVYVVITLLNGLGETLPSVPGHATTIVNSSTVGISIPRLNQLPTWIQNLVAPYTPTQANVYVAIVNHAAPAPPLSDYELFGSAVALGSFVDVIAAGTGAAPPTATTARVTPGQLPTPTTLPDIDRDPGGGTFPVGRDVYVLMTYTNALGETPAGPANSIINTNLNDGVQVTVAVPLGENNVQLFTITSVGIYEADVPTGDPAPPSSAFSLVGYYQPGAQPIITTTATGANPPLLNTTGPGGAIVADTATGGANGGQGFRCAAMGWINQMETFSGFTLASVVSTIIDLDGYEIGAFNVLTGMPNVVGRYIAFTVADSSQAGPFNWIGLVDLTTPSQNVVYPDQTLIDQVEQSATVFLDNVTTQGTFNFTDTFLIAENNVDDRLDIAIPPQGVRVDYLETLQRLAITGVPGLAAGAWIGLGEDFESFYADDSPVGVSGTGDICYGVTDKYKGIPFALMKSGGFLLSPNTGNPDSWDAIRRWGGSDPGEAIGPCGFRAWAACGKCIIFAHRSGLFKYDESDPDMMQKEIPKLWSRINWAAASTICVKIDEDTHTVIILVPTGASAVPNAKYVLSYIEGWQNPIHFSTFAGKEISMDAARRWSTHELSAFVCLRMERTLPPGGNAFLDGPSFETLPDSSFGVTQLLFASSAPDGTVQARTPGVFSDNGSGILWQYEPVSTGMMQQVCKPEGFNLNAVGQGTVIPSFVASRDMVSDEGGETKLIQEEDELMMDPIALTPKQSYGITRKCAPAVNEFWRPRFRSDGEPGTWISLKAMTTYVIPFTPGRDAGDR
jgi:hypothetical protein